MVRSLSENWARKAGELRVNWRCAGGISRRSRMTRDMTRRRAGGSAFNCSTAVRHCWRWGGVRRSSASLRSNMRAALLRVHVVEPGQLAEFVLLELRRQIAKAGLVLQGALLLGKREIAVVVHPLLEMFLVLGGPGGGAGGAGAG